VLRPEDYATFVSDISGWVIYRGIGTTGAVLGRRQRAGQVQDFCSTSTFAFASVGAGPDITSVMRIDLPELSIMPVDWSGGRIGALASSPEGNSVAVLALPGTASDQPAIFVRDLGGSWGRVESALRPDVSSRLAWIGPHHLAFESQQRTIAVIDLTDGSIRSDGVGCCPAAAVSSGRWFAVQNDVIVTFMDIDPSYRPADPDRGFSPRHHPSTLRATIDGEVLSWNEPRGLYKTRCIVQARGQRRIRVRQADGGLGTVIGPFA
jgi:hypothetical protein